MTIRRAWGIVIVVALLFSALLMIATTLWPSPWWILVSVVVSPAVGAATWLICDPR